MYRDIIEFLRTQSEPVVFADIYETLKAEYPMHPTLTFEVSKTLKRMVRSGTVTRSVVGYYKTKFSGVTELPLWGYELSTS